MMKTLEEECLLREHVQYHPLPAVPTTWEERMQLVEARSKASLPIDNIIIRQSHLFAEA